MRRSALPASASSAVLQADDLALCDPDVLAAATDRSEQRARQLIADGMPENDALAYAADDADAYRLLRDLANALGASVAYVNRPAAEAHLERSLSDAEWAAVIAQFTAMDLVNAVGDQGDFCTDWIEAILERAGVPAHDHAADGVDNGAEPQGAA